MRMVITHGLRAASFVLLMVWCSTAADSSRTLCSSDPPEGTVHPLLKWSNPEVIAETLKKPKYPRSAKKARIGAELILQAQIDETGSVTSLGVVSTRGVLPGAGSSPARGRRGGLFGRRFQVVRAGNPALTVSRRI